MARKKTSLDRVDLKTSISRRLREIRQELFGEHGGPEMARRLGLPARTWYNYESGVTVPAEVLLSFIDQTSANPVWLFSGVGPKYLRGTHETDESEPIDLIRRCLICLQEEDPHPLLIHQAGDEELLHRPEGTVPLPIVEVESLLEEDPLTDRAVSYVLASSRWITNPGETLAFRLDDEAMEPILPVGSILGVDRSATDPLQLRGRLVVANHQGKPLVRLLELSSRHVILKPSRPGRDSALIPIPWSEGLASPLLGQVVWSWTRFKS